MTRSAALKTEGLYRRMWALIDPLNAEWGFDVYFSRAEARRLKSDGERVVPVVVYRRDARKK